MSFDAENRLAVPYQLTRWICAPDRFTFETTDSVEPVSGIIGQQRALRALKLGLEIDAPGYNVYVSGTKGTGRTTAVMRLLKKRPLSCAQLRDYCYVYNFVNPTSPVLITFDSGGGAKFRREMRHFLRLVKKSIPAALENDKFLAAKGRIIEKYQQKERALLDFFKEELDSESLIMSEVKVGGTVHTEILIKTEDEPVSIDEVDKLESDGVIVREIADRLRKKIFIYRDRMVQVLRQIRRNSREMYEKVSQLEVQAGEEAISGHVDDLKENYGDPRIKRFLDGLKADILESLAIFVDDDTGEMTAAVLEMNREKEAILRRFEVNVVHGSSESTELPVVLERSPTYANLIGTMGVMYDNAGGSYTDHTTIRGGSLLRANHGFLVINALDVLAEAGAWPALKRMLRAKELILESDDGYMQAVSAALKPEPIPLHVKVIMIGDSETFNKLYNQDEYFQKVFKIKADFSDDLELSDENVETYAPFLRRLCMDEGLLPFHSSGVSRIVEFGVRHAGRRGRISAQFSEVADLAREAGFWAQKEGSNAVKAVHVVLAEKEIRYRNSLQEERLCRLLDQDVLKVDTEGERTGQVNGLTVFLMGNTTFGFPMRIAASVSMGASGIIDIERQAKMSGSLHDKGILILSGFLRERFAQHHPLDLSASICFEQSYMGIEGDSASSTEIYSLLSALADLPIRQDLAVTGSVSLKGDINPVGSVNEKIESFYDLCARRLLTGTQGVVIPAANVDDLMLRDDVHDAIRAGRFHIYAVERIEEGIELLTGVPAGERDESGDFPPGTVFDLVARRLDRYHAGFESRERPKQPNGVLCDV